jgi:hypothetical protein
MARFPLGLLLALVVVLGGLVVSCDSSDPSGPVGDVSLPADFPRDQVPLLDGRLTQATGTRAEGWSLTVHRVQPDRRRRHAHGDPVEKARPRDLLGDRRQFAARCGRAELGVLPGQRQLT